MVESVWAQIGVPVYTDLLAVDVKQVSLDTFLTLLIKIHVLELHVP